MKPNHYYASSFNRLHVFETLCDGRDWLRFRNGVIVSSGAVVLESKPVTIKKLEFVTDFRLVKFYSHRRLYKKNYVNEKSNDVLSNTDLDTWNPTMLCIFF